MIPEIALDMSRGNFPFLPNFHLLLIVWVRVPPSPPPHFGRPPFLDVCSKEPHKQRLLRQIRMAMSSASRLAAPHSSHQHRHHEFKGRKINDLRKWRRGWDSNPR